MEAVQKLMTTITRLFFKWHMFANIHDNFSYLAVCFPMADFTLFECEGKIKIDVVHN